MQGSGEGQIGIRVVVLGVNAARKAAYDAQHAFDQVNKSLGASAIAAEAFDRKLARLGAGISTFGRNLSFSLTIPLTVLNTALIGAGISFEDAFAGVGKTVEGVTTGFSDVATEMYGVSKGLTQAQKDAVFASGKLGQLTDIGEELRNGFRQLALEIPISANELARIGQVAGQLGVGAEELKDFTRTVALLTVSTDLAAEEAAFALARIGNIMGVAAEDLDTFARQAGAAIVALGNNAAATEPEIVNLTMRLAAAGRLANLSTAEILGLSATLAELGVKAERGGTAVSRIIYEMMEAATGATTEFQPINTIVGAGLEAIESHIRAGEEAGEAFFRGIVRSWEDFEELAALTGKSVYQIQQQFESNPIKVFDEALSSVRKLNQEMSEKASGSTQSLMARILGMEVEEFKAAFKRDAIGTIKLFLNNLVELQEQGKLTGEDLTQLGLSGVRVREVVNLLGPNMELLTDNIALANEQWVEQIALEEEAAKRFATVRSQLILLKNAFIDLGISIFDAVAPDIQKVIKVINGAVASFNTLDETTKRWIVRISLAVAALGPLLIVFGSLIQLVANSIGGFRIFNAAVSSFLLFPLNRLGGIFTGLATRLNIFKSSLVAFPSKAKSGIGFFIPNFIKDALTTAGLFVAAKGGFLGLVEKVLGSVSTVLSGGITKIFSLLSGGITKAFSAGSTVVKTFGKGIRLVGTIIFGGIETVFSVFGTVVETAVHKGLKSVFNFLFITLPKLFTVGLSVWGSVFGVIGKLFSVGVVVWLDIFKSLGSGVSTLFGRVLGVLKGVGGNIISIAGWIGSRTFKIFSFLFSGLTSGLFSFVRIIPTILAGVGIAFTLLFAPKIISQVIKNWESVLGSLKTAFTTFVDDLRNEGLERALLLLTSGGSLGSGRESGILGIAKALGASEEHARKFSYALGTATYWVIQIAKSVGTLVRRIADVVSGGESINNAFGSTSERIISLVTVISEFLEGFFEGWTSGFDGIISAVESLMPTISKTLSEIGRLFDNIFGKGKEGVDDFYKTLEPGTDSGISRAGEKLGEIVSTLLEYAIRGFTLVADVVGRITGAIADLVKAYNEGGIEGLLTELGNKLSGVWDFLLAGATLLWEDKIKPALSTAIEKTSSWLKTTGKDLLIDAATVLWGAFASVVDSILFGKAVTIQRPVEKTVTSMLSYTAKEGDNLLDIARKHNTSVNKIRAANNKLFEDYFVWPGESIMIPIEETFSSVEPETIQFPGILGAIKSLIENISSYLSSEETKNTIKKAFNDALSKIGELLSYLWEGSGDWQGLRFHFDGMLRSLEGWITENAPTFRRIGSEIAAAIVDGIQDALTPAFVEAIKEGDWERAIGELDKLLSGKTVLPPITSSGGMGDLAEWEQAVEALMAGLAPTRAQGKALLQKFRDHGIQISDGLAMGLETGILVTRQIAELNGILIGNDLTTGTKNALRIGSPSLVYRDIGADVIAGLAQGISTFLPNLNSVVSAMVNIFINAASQITSVMNTIRMQVFQIQGYMQTVQNSQMQAQLAYQQAQQAAMISAAQKTASAASTIGSAFTGSPLIPPVNQIIVNTQPQTTSTTTTNLNTTVSGVTMSTEDEAAYVIERTLRSVKGGLVSWN